MVGFSGVLGTSRVKDVSKNEGLRKYMLGVYNYMSVALSLSALVAFLAAHSGLTMALMSGPIGWIVAFSPLILSVVMSIKITTARISTIKALYFSYAILMGLSMSAIFLVFSGEDITKTFFITSAMFFSMSIYGYSTKSDLSVFRSYLIMAVFGILIASIVNIFTHSSGMSYAISFVAVFVFTFLVALDTQSLRRTYYAVCQNTDMATRFGIFGALQLYIDFLAIFMHLLQLFGSATARRD